MGQVSSLRAGGMFGSRGAYVTCSAAATATRDLHERLSALSAEASAGLVTLDYLAGAAQPASGGPALRLSALPAERCVATHARERMALGFGAQAAHSRSTS